MKILMSLGLALAMSFWSPGTAATPAQDPLVGTWILDRFVDTPEGEEPVYLYGERPVVIFIFTAGGHFSFNVMGDRSADEKPNSIPDANAEVEPSWYLSYFGTYQYDPAGPSWTTQVLGGNIPSYIGTEQTRSFKLDGNVMTILGTATVNGKRVRAERILHKVD